MTEILDKLPGTLPAEIFETMTRPDGVSIAAFSKLVGDRDVAEPMYAVTITIRATRSPKQAAALVAGYMGGGR